MQMGARWQAGDPPHRSVPAALHQEITRQEALHPAADSWTLTWLEGLPRCALDDTALLTLDGGGHAMLEVQSDDEDDDWLK